MCFLVVFNVFVMLLTCCVESEIHRAGHAAERFTWSEVSLPDPFLSVCCCFLQSVRWFDAETIGAAAIASLAAFVPTSEEGSKVTAFVLKKYAQQLQQLEDQRRKEQGTRCVLVQYTVVPLTHFHIINVSTGEPPADEAVPEAGARPASSRRKSAGNKLPTVPVTQVDNAALTKLKLGKAEQYIFVFAQVTCLQRGCVLCYFTAPLLSA
jgi:hypothetical protein